MRASHNLPQDQEIAFVQQASYQILRLEKTSDIIYLDGTCLTVIKINPKAQLSESELEAKFIVSKATDLSDQYVKRKYQCYHPKCRKAFHKVRSLLQHTKIHCKALQNFRCSLCDKAFITEKRLKAHKETHLA